MTGGVTQEQVRNVRRAIQDPMIGGWPLIHWEWVFSTDQHALGGGSDRRVAGQRGAAGDAALPPGVGPGGPAGGGLSYLARNRVERLAVADAVASEPM